MHEVELSYFRFEAGTSSDGMEGFGCKILHTPTGTTAVSDDPTKSYAENRRLAFSKLRKQLQEA